MPNYPTSKDDATSLPNPTGTSKQNNPDHGALHTAENAAIIALESKLGTGATVPATNTLLLGTGAGTSAWSQATSSQLAASISDETGSGSVVFANTPTLITPKVDTIQEATLNNGVTVGGVNLKAGVITTASAVTDTAIAAASLKSTKFNYPCKFSVYRAAALNSPSGSTVVFSFDSKYFDTGGNVDIVTNKGRFTATSNGFYYFFANIELSSTSNTVFIMFLYKNGVQAARGTDYRYTSGNKGGVVNGLLQLVAGDYVEVQLYTDVSSVVDVSAISNNVFGGWLLGAT